MQCWKSNLPALIRDLSLDFSQCYTRRAETHHEESTGDATLVTLQAEGATAYRGTGHIMGCREELYGIVLDLFLDVYRKDHRQGKGGIEMD